MFSSRHPYISHESSWDNLFNHERILSLLTISFILMTWMSDISGSCDLTLSTCDLLSLRKVLSVKNQANPARNLYRQIFKDLWRSAWGSWGGNLENLHQSSRSLLAQGPNNDPCGSCNDPWGSCNDPWGSCKDPYIPCRDHQGSSCKILSRILKDFKGSLVGSYQKWVFWVGPRLILQDPRISCRIFMRFSPGGRNTN